MKIFTVEYSGRSFFNWGNLGDDIQSLVAQKILPRVDGGVSRDRLKQHEVSGVISMNGYFGAGMLPLSSALEPFFFAFHVTHKSAGRISDPDVVAYLKAREPIGCRDRGTMEIMKKQGIEAFYSKCVTLTLPRREKVPENGRVYMVGLSPAAKSAVPKRIAGDAVVVDQAKLRIPDMSPGMKQVISQHLLDTYARTASLVITSKIHCAMPCIAMGIPVVFIYDNDKRDDYRVGLIEDLVGINYVGVSWVHRKFLNRFFNRINWSPVPVELEAEKVKIRNGYLEAFNRAVERYTARFAD